jgi:FMN reductase
MVLTGGGERHALVGEHQMRPLFGFFSALTIPTYVYASGRDFRDGSLQNLAVLRAEQVAGEMAAFLTQPALPQPPKVRPPLLVMRQV